MPEVYLESTNQEPSQINSGRKYSDMSA